MQVQRLRRRLQRHDVGERDVGQCLDEPRAGVVEQDRALAGGGVDGDEPAGPVAVLGQHLGEPGFHRGDRRRRLVEDEYARPGRTRRGWPRRTR